MQFLRELTLDRLINLYEGVIVADRKKIEESTEPQGGDLKYRMRQDKMILGALKCAKLHGYSGEE